MGHSQVNDVVLRLDNNWTESKYGHTRLRDSYWSADRVYAEGGIDDYLRGELVLPAQKIDVKAVEDVRSDTFGSRPSVCPGRKPMGRHGKSIGGMDLIAMDLQRARDQGLPSYTKARQELGLSEVRL